MKEPAKPRPGVELATGAAKAGESDDPMSLEAVSVPLGDLETMSEAFVEEFARLGSNAEEIYQLFMRRCYFGTHLYFNKHGAEATKELIHRVLSRTGVYRYTEDDRDA